MEELLKLIKANMKEGADIAAIETLAKGLNPLSGIDSTEKALEFINKTDILKRANDSAISKAVQSHDDKFNADKLPEMLKAEREKTIRELNPEETPEQKKIRELEVRLESSDREKALSTLQDELSSKAKDLEFDTLKARDFAVWGDQALIKLEEYATWQNEALNTRLSSEIKNKYSQVTPKSSSAIPADIDTRIKEARTAGNSNLALKLQMQKDTLKET